MTDEQHHPLGAYLLGGLAPAERNAFEAHLHDCEQCHTELAASAGIPSLLARAPQTPSAPLRLDALTSLLHCAATQRRSTTRRNRLLAGAAAVCLLTAGAATSFAARSTHTDRPATGRSVPIAAARSSHLSGDVHLTNKTWGTELTLTASGLPRHGTFTLQAYDTNGRPQQSAVWSATPDGTVTVTGATATHPGTLTSVTVSTTDGTVLATART